MAFERDGDSVNKWLRICGLNQISLLQGFLNHSRSKANNGEKNPWGNVISDDLLNGLSMLRSTILKDHIWYLVLLNVIQNSTPVIRSLSARTWHFSLLWSFNCGVFFRSRVWRHNAFDWFPKNVMCCQKPDYWRDYFQVWNSSCSLYSSILCTSDQNFLSLSTII